MSSFVCLKMAFTLRGLGRACFSEDDPPRNDEGYVGSGRTRGCNRELSSNARCAFPHSAESEMSFFPLARYCRLYAYTVVAHTDG